MPSRSGERPFILRPGRCGRSASIGTARDQAPHSLAVGGVGAAVAQLFFEGLRICSTSRFCAKDQRHHDPIIARAYLTVLAMVAKKAAGLPGGGVGDVGGHVLARRCIGAGAMANIGGGDEAARGMGCTTSPTTMPYITIRSRDRMRLARSSAWRGWLRDRADRSA